MLAFQNNAPASLGAAGLTASVEPVATSSAKFDLSLGAGRAARRDGTPAGIHGVLEYATDLFDRATRRGDRGPAHPAARGGGCASPTGRSAACDILGPTERDTILRGWNDTARPIPLATLPELFAAQAARTPRRHRGGVRGPDARPTRSSTRAPTSWRTGCSRLGVGPDVLVGLCVERSLEMVVALLGRPQGRRRLSAARPRLSGRAAAATCSDDAGVRVLLTRSVLCRRPCRYRPASTASARSGTTSTPSRRTRRRRICARPEHLAYMIYTSGSTGRPKGAANTHAWSANRLTLDAECLPARPKTMSCCRRRRSASTSRSGSSSGRCITGARLVLAAPGGHRDPARLIETIRTQRVTTLHFVPSMLQAFLARAQAPRGTARHPPRDLQRRGAAGRDCRVEYRDSCPALSSTTSTARPKRRST